MLASLLDLALHRRLVVIMVALALVAAGIWAFLHLQLEADPKGREKYKRIPRQIADAGKNNKRDAGGALLDLGQQSLAIRSSGLIQSSEDIANIVLDAPSNVPIYLRDVAR